MIHYGLPPKYVHVQRGFRAMSVFWEERYAAEGAIWGDRPSKSVERAHALFRQLGSQTLLIPGSGYGRNAQFFAGTGYDVTGIEVSKTALAIAQSQSPGCRYIHASVLDDVLTGETFDAIYCFNVLHLFLAAERRDMIRRCQRWLRLGGLAFFVVFSEKEATYGRGKAVEPETFETRPGRPAHYFTDADLRAHFADFTVMETGLVADPEDHSPEGPHVHELRYVCAQKL